MILLEKLDHWIEILDFAETHVISETIMNCLGGNGKIKLTIYVSL